MQYNYFSEGFNHNAYHILKNEGYFFIVQNFQTGNTISEYFWLF